MIKAIMNKDEYMICYSKDGTQRIAGFNNVKINIINIDEDFKPDHYYKLVKIDRVLGPNLALNVHIGDLIG